MTVATCKVGDASCKIHHWQHDAEIGKRKELITL